MRPSRNHLRSQENSGRFLLIVLVLSLTRLQIANLCILSKGEKRKSNFLLEKRKLFSVDDALGLFFELLVLKKRRGGDPVISGHFRNYLDISLRPEFSHLWFCGST